MKAVVTLAVFLSCSLIVFALAATDLRRKLVRRLARHGSTFSRVGASGNPGAVHIQDSSGKSVKACLSRALKE